MKGQCSIIPLLLIIISLQWILLAYVLIEQQEQQIQDDSQNNNHQDRATLQQQLHPIILAKTTNKDRTTTSSSLLKNKSQITSDTPQTNEKYERVAATLVLKSPKWFQRRYNMMIQNVLSTIPPSWAVQIFVAPHAQTSDGIYNVNPGLARLIQSHRARVIVTELPKELWEQAQNKPKLIWTKEWIWKEMTAEKVFLFSGNGALCGNSHSVVQDFVSWDYVGVPSHRFEGVGGDGSTHSLRSRSAMLKVLDYTEQGDGKKYDGNEREDLFFLKTMLEMNEKKMTSFQIAPPSTTELFGGTKTFVSKFNETKRNNNAETVGPPFILSGTLAHLENEVREKILDLCLELKVIFPSLHNPNCFGARPDGEKCRESICALKDASLRKGGC